MRSYTRWFYIVPPLFFAWAVANIEKLGLGIIVTNESFLQDMGLVGNPGLVGLLFTVFAIPYAIGNFLWGFAVDRFGARKVTIVSVTFWAISMVVAGLALTYGWLLASRIVLGAAEGALWAVSSKLVGVWFPTKERARAQGSYGYGQVLGPAAGSLILVATLASVGWRGSFFVLAALSLFLVLPLFIFLVRDTPEGHFVTSESEIERIRETSQEGAARPSNSNSGQIGTPRTTSQVIREYRFWLTTIAFMGTSVAFYGLAAWIPSYLIDVRNFSTVVMGAWQSAAFIIAVIAIAAGTFVADWISRPALVGAFGFVIAAIALVIGLTAQNASVAAPFVAIGQGTSLMSTSMSVTVLQRYFSAAILGRAGGIMTAIGNIVGGTAAAWMGWLVAVSSGSYFNSIMAVVGFLGAGAISFFILARDDKGFQTSTQSAPTAQQEVS